ncbi:RHS repeat-associated core domain-containing protein [Luteibacter sp. SG786]|uniref:RHS repeat-associated core domain-containing protein n=1 Tax=Luteibacter sp. SG786 TaxID=2587130 RepID=UPI00141F0160|nr:RHS repeat-associated core domain-containing protein [Luteibacter sp. SG786]NII55540.1 RHS repeat-associated protein [Luteibacter sp. SG786]
MPFYRLSRTRFALHLPEKLLLLIVSMLPSTSLAVQKRDAAPFVEYKSPTAEFFLTHEEAAAVAMAYHCARSGYAECILEASEDTDIGYAYTYSYVLFGQRLTGRQVGAAYYSCPSSYALYTQIGNTLFGPHGNREIVRSQGGLDLVCLRAQPPETASEFQSDLGSNQCNAMVGNPINVGAGNKFETHIDIAPTSASPLTWERFYNSGVVWADRENNQSIGTTTPATARLGSRWRGSYDRSLASTTVSTPVGPVLGIRLYRHTGERIDYVESGSRYESVVDPRGLLRRVGAGWIYRTPAGELETYDVAGQLVSIEGTAGRRIDFTYSDASTRPEVAPESGLLIRATDHNGRHLAFDYDAEGRVASIRQAGGATVTYTYSEEDGGGLKADLSNVMYVDGRSIEYRYNEAEYTQGAELPHHLTGIIDEHGRRFATYSYDEAGHAQGSEHALGAGKVMVGYSMDPAQSIVFGPTGGIHTYSFETVRGSQRLVGIDQPGGSGCDPASSKLEYDSNGKVAARTDFDGVVTRFMYDDYGNETERVEAADTAQARRVTTQWHPDLQLPVRTAAPGYEETLAYDARGNVTQRRVAGAIDPSESAATPSVVRTWTSTYDSSGHLLYVDGPRSDSTTPQRLLTHAYRPSADPGCAAGGACAYRQGDLWKVENALGQVEEILAYDAAGRVLRRRDANGVTTAYTYTPRGWLATETVTDVQGAVAVTRFDYTASGQVERITDADGVPVTFEYDDAQRLIGVTDAAGHRIRYTLDAAGQRTAEQIEDKDGTLVRRLNRTYDALGRVATQTDAYNHTISHTYDTMHRWTGSTDARGTRTTASYDALGRLRETIGDIDGVKARIATEHDPLDQLISLTDPKGLTTAYLTTGLGDLLYLDSPDTGKAWSEYDAAGLLTLHEAPGGIGSHSVTRDALGRMLTKTFADPALAITMTYDVADSRCPADERYVIGRRTSMSDGSGSTAYCYDSAGRIARKFQTAGGRDLSVAYRYTKAGRLAGATLPDGSMVSWRHDSFGQVTGIDVAPAGGITAPLLSDVTWNALGNAAGWSYGNGRHLARSYDANGRPTGVTDMAPGGLRHTLSYDEVGHVVGLDADGASRSFTYDGLGRLTETRDAGTNVALHQYTYDATGNRTSLTVGGATDHYVYATESHHLTTVDGALRRYDAAGSTIAIGALESIHDVTGQLASIRQTGTTLASYRYNGDGQRVTRIEGTDTTHTFYDEAGHWLGDYDADGKAIGQAIWLGNYPVGLIVDGRVLYIEPDHLGTPRAIIDPVRNVAVWQWKLEGEAFGADRPSEDPDGDGQTFTFDLRFPGQRYDAVSGLYYNYFRYFDPVSGRYIQSDPIGLAGGISTYAYVANNPYVRTDRFGLDDSAAMYNPEFWGRPQPSHPDYYHVTINYLIGTASFTLTRSGTVYSGVGPVYGGPKSSVNTRVPGFSVSSGLLGGCDHSPETVDGYVQGAATGASAYYGVGGGMSYNSSGWAIETGFGTPGAAYQVYEYNRPVLDTGISW